MIDDDDEPDVAMQEAIALSLVSSAEKRGGGEAGEMFAWGRMPS